MYSDSITSITFYKPSHTVGGEQLLYARLASYIADNYGVTVFVVDYADGYVYSLAKKSTGVELIDYYGDDLTIPGRTNVFTPPTSLKSIFDNLIIDKESDIFVWSLHPMNFTGLMSGARFINKLSINKIKHAYNILHPFSTNKIARLISELSVRNAILFMDHENFATNQTIFDLDIEPQYLQIPFASNPGNSGTERIVKRGNNISIGWIGRMVDFKTNSLRALLHNLSNFNNLNGQKFIVHIIGDGDRSSSIHKLDSLNNIEIVMVGTLHGNELHSYLMDHIDLVFAMGTSLLEAASLKIPTVAAEYSYSNMDPLECKYEWLYDSYNYNLGKHVGSSFRPGISKAISNILTEFKNDINNTIGDMCYEYCQSNHNIKLTADKMIALTKEGGMKASDVNEYIRKLYRV